ncbi:MAG: hypothetical protein ACPLSP_07145, partial [Fervidicoccus fontis]
VNQTVFPIKVIEVKGDRAVIAVNGNFLEVTSKVPLSPGQELLVRKAEAFEKTEKWQILRDLSEENRESFLSRLGLSDEPENKVIADALSRAELPITEENINMIRSLIDRIGISTYHDLHAVMASIIASLKFAIPWNLLLPLLTPFIDKVVIAEKFTEKTERRSELKKDGEKTAETIACRLKESINLLQKAIYCFVGRLRNPEELDFDLDDEQKFLLGGQLLAWSQGNIRSHEGYYYIPLFLPAGREESLWGEMLVLPKPRKDKSVIRIVVNLTTHHLGWIRVDFCLHEKALDIRMLAEKQSTKDLIDGLWSELEEMLTEKTRFVVIWSGCRIGTVKSLLRDLVEGYYNPRPPDALDVMI